MSRAKQILILALIVLLSGPLRAQPATRPARGEGNGNFPRVRAVLDDLKLSDEQKKKIDDIFNSVSENLRAMAGEMKDMAQEQRQEKYKEFMTDLREQISKELTPQQKEKFNQIMQGLRFGGGGPGATTQPGTGPNPATLLMMKMRAKIQELSLSDDQKQKVKKVYEEMGEKLRQIASSTERGSAEMREKARDLFDKTRESIKEILTPEQFEKLTSGLRNNDGSDKPATQPKMIEEKMKDEKMSDEKKSPKADEKEKSSAAENETTESLASAPQVGQIAPAFTLQKIGGQPLQLSAFKGKVVVLTFASYSSPTFRRRASALEDLRDRYDNRANFLLVYTKEAHPKGGWEVDRNKAEEIDVEQPADIAGREKLAKKMHDALRFNWPVLIDSMDDSAAKAYGAGECTTLIINRDGTIASRLQWSDPYTLKRQLEDLLSKPTTRPAP